MIKVHLSEGIKDLWKFHVLTVLASIVVNRAQPVNGEAALLVVFGTRPSKMQ